MVQAITAALMETRVLFMMNSLRKIGLQVGNLMLHIKLPTWKNERLWRDCFLELKD
jgi:hypothetical protein